MKRTYKTFLACLLMLLYLGASGQDKVIATPVEGNLYLSGNSLTIDAVVGGDLTAAGRVISVNDSINDDVLLAGADILINGVLGDDAKIAGRDIRILKNVHGDLILAGASIQINRDAIIEQNLTIIAGEAIIDGTIKGKVRVTGGNITFNGVAMQDLTVKADELVLNGSVYGPAMISGDEIEVGDGLELKGDVTYWCEEGELDLASYSDGTVFFDQELNQYEGDESIGSGLSTIRVLYNISIMLVIVLLVVFFSKSFQKAGNQLNRSYVKNLSYGVLYFVGLLVLTILSLVIIIGIPVGLVALTILAFSLLFANAFSSLVVAHGIKIRYDKSWNKWETMIVALLVFLALRLVFMIPYAGWFLALIVIGMAFGSFVLSHVKLKR